MSISTLESREKQYSSKLTKLNKDFASSVGKENIAVKNANKATIKLQKGKTSSQVNSATREINRENEKIAAEKKKQAHIQKKISDTFTKLNITRLELSKERDKKTKKVLENMGKENQRQISSIVSNTTYNVRPVEPEFVEHDIFFSYAHEDSDYADELVNMMKEDDIDIIFDKNDLIWGQSIIDFIDSHLRTVRFAILLITPAYLEKYWTNYELKSLLQRHSRTNGNQSLILPIWHNVTADEVAKRSLALTDFNALLTAINTKEDIVNKVKKLLE